MSLRRLTNNNFKTEAEVIADGGLVSDLLNDTKIYVTANAINKTLDDAIIDGDLGGVTSDYTNAAFQNFLDVETNKLVATTATGAPAAGFFHSSIVNRKAITDLTKDGLPRFGIERISAQNIFRIDEEAGPNGEIVSGLVGDKYSQIRFVGNWVNFVNNNGNFVATSLTNDYVEVTFYGTGLNLLFSATAATYDYRYSINGGAESQLTATPSGVLNGRNYAANNVLAIATSLTLGVYTVKIRHNSGAIHNLAIYGFEILNERLDLLLPESRNIISGRVISTLSSSTPYNSGFTNVYGTPGTRGGRVLVYKDVDGITHKDIQYTDTAQQNLLLANHTNEEVSRVHFWREFGAGRADDFSISNVAGPVDLAFTLDDGTTNLLADNVSTNNNLGLDANGATFTLTFVGTGLDIIASTNALGGADTYDVTVDGTSIGNPFPTGLNRESKYTIVSGLPYGTHIVKFTRVTAVTYSVFVSKFIVYQPKTPALPMNSVAVGAYNLMANYVTPLINGIEVIAQGVMRKLNTREFVYVGTFTATLETQVTQGGTTVSTTTAGNYVEYTFFGTGFEIRHGANSSLNYTVSVDGSTNLTAFSTGVYGNTLTFTAATGVLSTNGLAQNGQGVYVNGLALDVHTVRITRNAGTMTINAIDIITPIYSPVSMLPYDQQNTLMIGSNALADARNTSAIKEVGAAGKNVSQAVGITIDPTTTATQPVPVPDLSVTHFNRTGKIKVMANCTIAGGTLGGLIYIVVNGVITNIPLSLHASTTQNTLPIFGIVNVSPGFNKVDIYWQVVSGGTITATGARRILIVEEVE